MRSRYANARVQFRVLYRVFLLRVVDLELLSPESDVVRLLGQFAAILAAISFAFTAPLILVGGRLPDEALWTMEHLLISTTMVVVGIFAVLSWESTFPERRDLLVLGPLPVPVNLLFAAKLAALVAALGLSVLALNVFTGMIWPLLFSSAGSGIGGAVRSLAAYWLTVVMSGLFLFCCVLGVQWAASQVLPRQVYLRVSALLQIAVLCLFVGVYFLEPSLETLGALTAPENQRMLAWLPTYWFLGLFQQLRGAADPAFLPLAREAWQGLGVAVLGAGTAVLFSYVRTLRRIVEEPDILPGAHGLRWSPRLGGALQTAIALFSARTLMRSRQHRVLLTFYLGVGFGVVMAYVKTPLAQQGLVDRAGRFEVSVPYLAASILMLCCALGGMRVVLSMPVDLRANVIFRLTEVRGPERYARAVRWTFYTLAYAPVLLLVSAPFLWMRPWPIVAGHLAVLCLLGVMLCELGLFGFKKVPFTCSYLPGKTNVPMYFWGCVLLILPLTNKVAEMELRALRHPQSAMLVLVLVAAAAMIARWRATMSIRRIRSIEYEEMARPELQGLGLDRGNAVVAERG